MAQKGPTSAQYSPCQSFISEGIVMQADDGQTQVSRVKSGSEMTRTAQDFWEANESLNVQHYPAGRTMVLFDHTDADGNVLVDARTLTTLFSKILTQFYPDPSSEPSGKLLALLRVYLGTCSESDARDMEDYCRTHNPPWRSIYVTESGKHAVDTTRQTEASGYTKRLTEADGHVKDVDEVEYVVDDDEDPSEQLQRLLTCMGMDKPNETARGSDKHRDVWPWG